MKICLLTPRFPFPEKGGDVLRINNIARYLKRKGHTLVLVSFEECDHNLLEAQDLYDRIYTVKRHNAISALFSLVYLLRGLPIQNGYYFSPAYESLFKRVIKEEKPDLYISHLLRMAGYLERNNLQDCSIIEMTDTLSRTYTMAKRSKGFSFRKMIYSVERSLIENYERHAIRKFKKNVLVSQVDIDYMRALYPDSVQSLVLHTNGVVKAEARSWNADKICFVGNMRTMQNQDAAIHFAKEVFPLIKAKRPDAIFYIIGAEPPKTVKHLHDGKNIIVTGFVEELDTTLGDACVAVAPVRIAAGIQNKVLVAMAHGVPVILSTLISKAIPELEHGINCFVDDDKEVFANHCLQLMNDRQLRQSIALAGQKTVREHYSWDGCLAGYEVI